MKHWAKVFYLTFVIVEMAYFIECYQDMSVGSFTINLFTMIILSMGSVFHFAKRDKEVTK